MLAVKIEIRAGSFYTVGRHLAIANDKGYKYSLGDNELALSRLNRNLLPIYFLLPLIHLYLSTSRSNRIEDTNTIPMPVAGSANTTFKKNLIDNTVLGKTIKPSEALDGLLIINRGTFEGLKQTLK